jgi:hypothetical protein
MDNPESLAAYIAAPVKNVTTILNAATKLPRPRNSFSSGRIHA